MDQYSRQFVCIVLTNKSLFIFLFIITSSTSFAATYTLYDGSEASTPDEQGMLVYNPLNVTPLTHSYSAVDQAAVYDTINPNMTYLGYYKNNITLNRNDGYSLDFTVKVNQETHTVNTRAGLSIVAMSGDSVGIILEFWEDTIAKYIFNGTGYEHGTVQDNTAVLFDTTAGFIHYTLNIKDNSFVLGAEGYSQSLFTGSLTSYNPSHWFSNPNIIAIGDITSTAAEANVSIRSLSVNTVPEPLTFVLLALSIFAVKLRLKKNL